MDARSYSIAWCLCIFPPLDGTGGERLELWCAVWHLTQFLPLDDIAGGDLFVLFCRFKAPSVSKPLQGYGM